MSKCWRWNRLASLSLLVGLLSIVAHPASGPAAANANQASDRIILTIETVETSGQDAKKHTFSLRALQKLRPAKVTTSTPWTQSTTRFEGVLLRDLLAAAQIQGKQLRAVALNNYAANIPVADTLKYDVLLAYKVDGRIIGVREKGPLWIIYPLDQHAELKAESIYAKSVWQLTKLVVSP